MLLVRNISKQFGKKLVAENVTFTAYAGEVLGLLGVNGSGKTTITKIVAGMLGADDGSVELDGELIEVGAASEAVGYVPAGRPFYPEMKVFQFLNFIAKIRGFQKRQKFNSILRVVKDTGIEDFADKKISSLSAEQKCRLSVAQALLHDPKVLIMDEPTAELDPNEKFQIRKLFTKVAKERYVLLATKNIEDISSICSRVIILADGKIVVDSNPDSLAMQSPLHNTLELKVTKTQLSENIVNALQTVSEIERIEVLDSKSNEISLRLYPHDKCISLSKVTSLARDLGWDIIDLQTVTGKLEEVFRTITTRYTQSKDGLV